MFLAELEVRHSRPIAPTRRVALGDLFLPTDPAPGYGGLLLAALVGSFAPRLADDLRDGLDLLLDDLEQGRRVIQPRLRHRFQKDSVGLDRSRHKLIRDGTRVRLEIDEHGAPMPQILAAVYAAGMLSSVAREPVFRLLRRATRWQGEADDRLVAFLSGAPSRGVGPGDEGWALATLGFRTGKEPTRSEINRRFRSLVRDAHPDHGGAVEDAASRIQDLTEAKRILFTAPAL